MLHDDGRIREAQLDPVDPDSDPDPQHWSRAFPNGRSLMFLIAINKLFKWKWLFSRVLASYRVGPPRVRFPAGTCQSLVAPLCSSCCLELRNPKRNFSWHCPFNLSGRFQAAAAHLVAPLCSSCCLELRNPKNNFSTKLDPERRELIRRFLIQ